jgi:hypothetical protein
MPAASSWQASGHAAIAHPARKNRLAHLGDRLDHPLRDGLGIDAAGGRQHHQNAVELAVGGQRGERGAEIVGARTRAQIQGIGQRAPGRASASVSRVACDRAAGSAAGTRPDRLPAPGPLPLASTQPLTQRAAGRARMQAAVNICVNRRICRAPARRSAAL